MFYISEIYLYGIVYGIDLDVLPDLLKWFTFQKYICILKCCICLCMEIRIYLCILQNFAGSVFFKILDDLYIDLDDLVMG
jgi:hypothetical protein